MAMIEARGGFLYEHRPDVCPQGYLTDDELCYWAAYYDTKQTERVSRG